MDGRYKSKRTIRKFKAVLNKKAVSVFQPQWSPANILYFVADQTGWWNIYRYQNKIESVFSMDAEFGEVSWNFGASTYSFINDHLIAASYLKNGIGYLGLLNTTSKTFEQLNLPYTDFSSIKSNTKNIYFFAGGPFLNPAFIELNVKTKKTTSLQKNLELKISNEYISAPKQIAYKALDGNINYAFYYSPKNLNYVAPKGEKPPLIVLVHGDSTSRAPSLLALATQFWTSRGYAILALNYEGSTGYGRAYRE